MGRIINIMRDEKFIDHYIKMSELFGVDKYSVYYVFSQKNTLSYIQTRKSNLILKRFSEEDYLSLLDVIEKDDVIVFHAFYPPAYELIKQLPGSIKKIWIFWGFEGYGVFPYVKFINLKTYKLGKVNFSFKDYGRFYVYKYAHNWYGKHGIDNKEIINRMDVVATWARDDIRLALKINPKIKPVYFSYYTREFMHWPLPEKIQLNTSGHLLLGNSGDPTNNHMEALLYLKKIKFQGDIYVPLSYGGSQIYRENLIALGNQLFGERFKPLTKFLALHEYNKIFNQVQYVWMNHIRQQAAGNLFTAFAHGKVVILHKKSYLRSTFQNWGLSFYDKQLLKSNTEVSPQALINNATIIHNKLDLKQNKKFFDYLKTSI